MSFIQSCQRIAVASVVGLSCGNLIGCMDLPETGTYVDSKDDPIAVFGRTWTPDDQIQIEAQVWFFGESQWYPLDDRIEVVTLGRDFYSWGGTIDLSSVTYWEPLNEELTLFRARIRAVRNGAEILPISSGEGNVVELFYESD